jgi:hypothetical protein
MPTATKPKKRSSKAKLAKKYTVYAIKNTVTGKWYVGITGQEFSARQAEHLYQLRKGIHHSKKLQNSFNKHGEDVWQWHVFPSEKMTWEKAKSVEKEWIKIHKAYTNGYNMTPGGDGAIPYGGWFGEPCEWNGEKYSSISDAARMLNIARTTMKDRIARGYICDDDMQIKRGGHPKAFVWEGKQYISRAAAARETGVSKGTMQYRADKGFICQDDTKRSGKSICYNGVQYTSLTQAAKALNISISTMRYRLSKGYASDSDMQSYQRKVQHG